MCTAYSAERETSLASDQHACRHLHTTLEPSGDSRGQATLALSYFLKRNGVSRHGT